MKFYNKKQCFSKILSVFLPLMLLFMIIPAVAFSGGDWDILDDGAGSAQNSAAEAATPMLANMQTSARLENPNLSNVAFGPDEPLAPMPLAVGNYFQDVAGVWYKVLTEDVSGGAGTAGQNTVEVTDDGQRNRGYSGTILDIPATVTNASSTVYEVVEIASYAFYQNTNITSVTIPDSVTSIGQSAFSLCTELTAVTIPNSVTSIEAYLFYGCTGLTAVTIPNSVTSIGEAAFYFCTGLASVTIPNSVTSIGIGAFYYCTGLTSVTIPNSVTSIGQSAFSLCTELTAVTIPNSVTSIEAYLFYGCTGLTSVIIPNSVTSIGAGAFNGCTGLTSVTIPNSVTSIGQSAFAGCPGLTAVTIPNSVTSIEAYLFESCTGLASVTIPNSVTSIGQLAFRGCTGLTSVTIPNSVTSIGLGAFNDCTGLTSVTIPNSVTSIGDSAFSYCTGLTEIYFMGAVPPSFGNDVFYDVPNINTSTLYYPSGAEANYDPATFAGGAFSNWSFLTPFAPGFGTNPSAKTLLEGGGTSFSVVATGGPKPALQWQVCTDGVVWTDITDGGVYSGATTATLQLAGVPFSYNGYQYRCVASNAFQAGVVSGVAVLTVNSKTITNPPKTGDNGSIMPWIILTLAPPCGLGALWFYRKKKERADLA